jgi:hypothetical protein
LDPTIEPWQLSVSEGLGEEATGELLALVEEIVARVEALRADVARLKSNHPGSASAGNKGQTCRRKVPSEDEPVELDGLCEWVESFAVRYAAAGDWLRPCWWRHGFVVEEMAALRLAWLAIYDAVDHVDPMAGLRWHDEADKCRERIRRTIAAGPGCSAVSHKPDEPVSEDPRWADELMALRNESPSQATRSGGEAPNQGRRVRLTIVDSDAGTEPTGGQGRT